MPERASGPPSEPGPSRPENGPPEPPFCARCAAHGPTCCIHTEVYASPGDVRRIARATGRAAGAFVERRPAAAPSELEGVAERDPRWAALFAGGDRRVLRHGAGGACVFLRGDGCALALEDRPFVCRLHPYFYDGEGLYGLDTSRCAPPARDNEALAAALLGLDRARAEAWRAALYREIDEDLAAGSPAELGSRRGDAARKE